MTLRMDAGKQERTYKIGQAAKLLDVKPFVLRFWESEFKDVLVPVRTPAGQRAYTEANVATVREIKRLLYDEGLTIEGAKKRLGQGQSVQQGPPQTIASPPRSAAPASAVSLPLLAPSAESADQAALARAESARVEVQAEACRAVKLSATLTATLSEVARELTAIRDLLT
jgi:DNA-binding transcriptional MerR regulator